MTREEILRMKAGRELDAAVCERVMGWTIDGAGRMKNPEGQFVANKRNGFGWSKVPHYSSDIKAAWQVLTKNGYQGAIGYMGTDWVCHLWSHWDEEGAGVDAHLSTDGDVGCEGDDAPALICKTALLAALLAKAVDASA